jgi:predicted TPR repeat methyltransferase
MSATAIPVDPNRQFLESARALIAKGELREAALVLNQAQRKIPNDPRVFMVGSWLAEKSGNLKAAFESMRRSVAMAPDWGPGLLELALLLARQNQFQEALETAEKVTKLEPRNLQVLANVIDIAHRAGHTEMAIQHLRRGLELVPGDPQLTTLLARDLSSQGAHEESIALWGQLIDAAPQNTEYRMGRVLAQLAAGKPRQAIPDTTALLEIAPGDSVVAYYNALAHGQTPERQPVELSQRLFDGMADVYDQHVVRGLRYQLPKQVGDQILRMYPDKKLDVLDLGCGTGLLGVCLGRIDGFLIGVDVSMKMIEQAARHNVYDRFHTVNLHNALHETPDAIYQVITALDVFIYTGDLQETIPNARRILVPGGHLIFSCETAAEDGPDLVLLSAERYAHKRSHVEALCRQAGFVRVDIEDTVLRYENNQPVPGFVVTAHKAA